MIGQGTLVAARPEDAADAGSSPACVAVGSLADRIGRPVTTIAMLVVSGACAALVGVVFAAPTWMFVLDGRKWGAVVVAGSAQFSAIVTKSGRRFAGTALAVQLGAGYGVTILAILTLPLVADWFGGWHWVFSVLVPGPLVGALAMTALKRIQGVNE